LFRLSKESLISISSRGQSGLSLKERGLGILTRSPFMKSNLLSEREEDEEVDEAGRERDSD